MPRPKRPDVTQKLNLLIALKAKRRAFRMATHRGISVGRLFEQLLIQEEARAEKV